MRPEEDELAYVKMCINALCDPDEDQLMWNDYFFDFSPRCDMRNIARLATNMRLFSSDQTCRLVFLQHDAFRAAKGKGPDFSVPENRPETAWKLVILTCEPDT